jgi:hypothetical protein
MHRRRSFEARVEDFPGVWARVRADLQGERREAVIRLEEIPSVEPRDLRRMARKLAKELGIGVQTHLGEHLFFIMDTRPSTEEEVDRALARTDDLSSAMNVQFRRRQMRAAGVWDGVRDALMARRSFSLSQSDIPDRDVEAARKEIRRRARWASVRDRTKVRDDEILVEVMGSIR